jgi:hypothetical protein
LRKAILDGVLVDPIPGEYQLAHDLGVSRPSLRSAMQKLEYEGLISRANGRRAQLNPMRRNPDAGVAPTLRILCPAPHDNTQLDAVVLLMEMRAYFAAKGIGWEEIFDVKLASANPVKLLRKLVVGRKRSCWLLVACPIHVHRWFKEAGLPVLSLGSAHSGVELPSIDLDYRAVGWHAAGTMVKHGHQHIGILQPEPLNAGDRNSYEGFKSYIAKMASGTKITEIRIAQYRPELRSKLIHVVSSRSKPTALFSLLPEYSVTAMVSLLRLGLRIPADISLVSRDSTPFIDRTIPDLTRYKGSFDSLTRHTERIAQALLAGRYVPAKTTLVQPSFIAGNTLGSVRA